VSTDAPVVLLCTLRLHLRTINGVRFLSETGFMYLIRRLAFEGPTKALMHEGFGGPDKTHWGRVFTASSTGP
jgi:hypothetical protein